MRAFAVLLCVALSGSCLNLNELVFSSCSADGACTQGVCCGDRFCRERCDAQSTGGGTGGAGGSVGGGGNTGGTGGENTGGSGGETQACTDGQTRACQSHPGFDGLGLCHAGVQSCAAGVWSTCTGSVGPAARDCSSPLDHDCDGAADNTIDAVCACVTGNSRACDVHPGLDGVGRCAAGHQTCDNARWSTCTGSVGPAPRDCSSANDNDCDGRPDNVADSTCVCAPGQMRACDTHPQDGVGVCRAGSQSCVADGGTSNWTSCVGSVGPSARVCGSSLDNDCNGQLDNVVDMACACAPGATRPCGSSVGQCRAGTQRCVVADGGSLTTWATECVGATLPAPRNCASALDNDCNGQPDNTVDATCACAPGATRGCGSAVGQCRQGTQSCVVADGGTSTSWSAACAGGTGPAPRNCASALDNDCNGQPDNTIDAVCTCVPGATQACGTHPGLDGKGICRAGTQTCVANGAASAFGACMGSVGPSAAAEGCEPTGPDNNCDGIAGNDPGCTITFFCPATAPTFTPIMGCGCNSLKIFANNSDGNSLPVYQCSDGSIGILYAGTDGVTGPCGVPGGSNWNYGGQQGWVRRTGGAGWVNPCGIGWSPP